MAHWGWYWRVKKKHVRRVSCLGLPILDSFKVVQNGVVNNFTVSPLDIKGSFDHKGLRVTYRHNQRPAYVIPIEKQACNYGGYRYFFHCPLCNRRMRYLYFSAQSVFLCRKCLNLTYETQRLRPSRRYDYMHKKTQGIILDKGGSVAPRQKPPRMHRKTHDKLRDRLFMYEEKQYEAIDRELIEWHGTKAEPFLG